MRTIDYRRPVIALLSCAAAMAALAVAAWLQVDAGAAQGQTTTTVAGTQGTVTLTTTSNLLQGTPGASAPTSSTVAAAATPDTSRKITHTTNWKVWVIVAGLVAVALLMALLTWRYWRNTRPPSGGQHGRRESRYSGVEISLPSSGLDEPSRH